MSQNCSSGLYSSNMYFTGGSVPANNRHSSGFPYEQTPSSQRKSLMGKGSFWELLPVCPSLRFMSPQQPRMFPRPQPATSGWVTGPVGLAPLHPLLPAHFQLTRSQLIWPRPRKYLGEIQVILPASLPSDHCFSGVPFWAISLLL